VTNPDLAETTATFIDRSSWPPGPWDDEPDRVDWRDEITGYPCFVKRGPTGAWCGYVGLPPGHRFHDADPDEVPVDVHGGLTFGAPCDEDDGPTAERICHVPRPGEPADVFWLGFDCAHYNDVSPGMLGLGFKYLAADRATYKPVSYARDETTALARQLAETTP
jgi:hypothetical protein